MDADIQAITAFLESVHPYDTLPRDELASVARSFRRMEFKSNSLIYVGDSSTAHGRNRKAPPGLATASAVFAPSR